MKTLFLIGIASALGVHLLHAQVVPSTPTKFGKRGVGALTDGGGSATMGLSPQGAKPQPVVREIQYITLSDARQWTSTDGKALVGKLLAFEQTEQVLPAGQAATTTTTTTAAPVLPARPTLIRNGQVRLLVQQKAFALPLERLSQADQDFIQALDAAIAKKAGTTSPSPAPAKAP
jgi:hypothetical protein